MASMYKGGGNTYREGGITSTRDLSIRDLKKIYEEPKELPNQK